MQSVAGFFSRWSPSLASKTFSTGLEAYASGDYTKAVTVFKALARQGNASAQAMLGLMYHNGKGLAFNYDEAAHWIRLAANQGVPDAQFNLGVLYEDGKGVSKDVSQAIRWYRLAAQWGASDAQVNLSNCFRNGLGVDKNESLAAWWIRLAAEQGDRDAQLNLGTRYRQGLGVSQDLTEAYFWFDLAATAGGTDDVGSRNGAVPFTSPEQVKTAQIPIGDFAWKPKSAAESAIDIFKMAARQNVEAIHQALGEEEFGKLRTTSRELPSAGRIILEKTWGARPATMAKGIKNTLDQLECEIDLRLNTAQNAGPEKASSNLKSHQAMSFIRRLDDLADVGTLLGDRVAHLVHNVLEFHLSLIGTLEGKLDEESLTLLMKRFSLKSALRAPGFIRFAEFQLTTLPLLPW